MIIIICEIDLLAWILVHVLIIPPLWVLIN